MNIIQINSNDIGGGVETVVRLHHAELMRQRCRAQLLVARKGSQEPSIDQIPYRRGPKGWRRIAHWIEKTTGLQYIYSPSFRAIDQSFRFQPDIIHLHSLHGGAGYAELAILKRLSRICPLVLSVHDMWLMTGHCGYSLSCERWMVGCGSCPDLSLYPAISRDATAWNFTRKLNTFKNVDIHLISPSKYVNNKIKLSPILSHFPVHIVQNPIDTDVFFPTRNTDNSFIFEDKRENVLIMVAQSFRNPYKGVGDVVKIINNLKIRNLTVLLVGRHSDEIASNIYHRCIPINHTSSRQALAEYYRMANLLIMPSQDETFGLVAGEAMACGTPVIAFDVGALSEIINNNIDGFIIPHRDLTMFGEKIEMVMNDRALQQKFSQNAASSIQRRFSATQHTRTLIQLYKNIKYDFDEQTPR